jgi:signal transduction histidine kinase
MRAWRSPLNRLSIVFGMLIFGVYALVNSLSFYTLLHQDQRARAEVINSEIEGLDQIYSDEDIAGLVHAIDQRARKPRDPLAVYGLFNAQGLVLAGQFSSLPTRPNQSGWVTLNAPIHGLSKPLYVYVQILEDDEVLIAGLDITERAQFSRRLAALGAVALTALALTTLLFTWLFRNAINRELKEPLTVMHRFSQGDLDQRVSSNGSGDSFDQLGQVLNHAMRRIEALFFGIKHTSDAIAHDLRTPLSRMRTNLEQLRHECPVGAQTLVEASILEADQLIGRFGALLRLSKLESQSAQLDTQAALDLRLLAADAVEFWQPIAENNQQVLTLAENQGLTEGANGAPLLIAGDRDQLFQLLSNLLENAVKYTPAHGRIVVSVFTQGVNVVMSVQDSGPGVKLADQDRIFDRFVRLEADRGTPGFGLGLSLVRAIARAHGANIELHNCQPGLQIQVRFRGIGAGET